MTYNTTWTSDFSGIAAVGTAGTNKGRVNGVSSGTTGINAAYGGLTVTAPVTVTARTIDTLTVSGATLLTSGNQVKFTASALYTDLTRTDVTEDVVWSLSVDKPYVAILADSAIQPGQVVGVDTGWSALRPYSTARPSPPRSRYPRPRNTTDARKEKHETNLPDDNYLSACRSCCAARSGRSMPDLTWGLFSGATPCWTPRALTARGVSTSSSIRASRGGLSSGGTWHLTSLRVRGGSSSNTPIAATSSTR